jgi:hypothetical protein
MDKYKKNSLQKLTELFSFIAAKSGFIRITNESEDERGNNNIIKCRCEEESIIQEFVYRVKQTIDALKLDSCGGVRLVQRKTDNGYFLSIYVPLDSTIFSYETPTNAFARLDQNSRDFDY